MHSFGHNFFCIKYVFKFRKTWVFYHSNTAIYKVEITVTFNYKKNIFAIYIKVEGAHSRGPVLVPYAAQYERAVLWWRMCPLV